MNSHVLQIISFAVRAGQHFWVKTPAGGSMCFTAIGQAMLAYGNLKMAIEDERGDT